LHALALLEQALQRLQQFIARKRLGQVVVGTRRHAPAHVGAVVQRGQQHEGNRCQIGVGPHGVQQFKTVHLRHADVRYHQVAGSIAQQIQRLQAVASRQNFVRLLRIVSSSSTIRMVVMPGLQSVG
jgi:hypothetical protein